jgi:DNA adenine methylase
MTTTEPAMKISAVLPWFGGKRTMAPRIARELCSEDGSAPKAFWDVFCGGLSVTMAMPRCAHMTVNDLHGDLINLARVLQDPRRGSALYRRLRRTLAHETLFDDSKQALADALAGDALFGVATPLSDDDRAFHFFVVSWLGRNGVAGTERTNYQPAVRWTSGGGHGGIRFANAVDSIPAWRRRLRELTILQRDVFEILPKLEDQEGTSIYADPPYLRDGDSRSGSCAYEHEFKDRDHLKLARELSRFKRARVVVSYYDNQLLRELYAGWTFVDCLTQKNLHVQNRRGVGRCEAPEVLIINGPSYTEIRAK